MSEVTKLVEQFHLLPHPEGGFYKETYRSEFSTGIYYLLERNQKSSLHRISSDEMWHFYSGDELIIVELTNDGGFMETRLNKKNVQYVVKANVWFGAYLPTDSNFAFCGCTVAPAFHFENFEMGNAQKLLHEYPGATEIIEKLLT